MPHQRNWSNLGLTFDLTAASGVGPKSHLTEAYCRDHRLSSICLSRKSIDCMSSTTGLVQAEFTAGGIRTRYFTGGDGPVVVFLHGWGLAGTPLYFQALSKLTSNGYRVYAPLLPGFGSDELPSARFTLTGYAEWVRDFIEHLPIDGPVALVGYSFGGGIAIRTAHDYPELIERLILVNSIGGSTWTNNNGDQLHVRHRPLWDWGRGMGDDVTDDNHAVRLIPSILTMGIALLLRRPSVIWRSGQLARSADLTAELGGLRRNRLSVAIIWSRHDRVIPASTISSLRNAAGDHLWVTVEGSHGWLNTNQSGFCDIITNILDTPPANLAGEIHHLATAFAA